MMRKTCSLVCAALLICAPTHFAFAEPPDTDNESETGEGALGRVVVLLEGDAAPHDGLLITQPRMTHYLDLRVRLDEQEGLATARLLAIQNLTSELDAKEKSSWWDRNSFWLGMTTGLVLSIGIAYGTARALEAADAR